MNFYKMKRWKNKRKVILRRDDYRCRQCSRYGNTTQANTVHHIYPLEDYPEYKLTNKNLISLCNGCHEKMHDRLTGKPPELWESWKQRTVLSACPPTHTQQYDDHRDRRGETFSNSASV